MGEINCLQVALYIPNLIGYARFFFLALALPWVFHEDLYYLTMVFYGLSYLLDAFDGKAARAFK